MKDSVDFAIHFFEENHVRRVLIGGTDDNVALFRSLLPKAWQSLVVGAFPMSMTASHSDVLARTMQIGLEAEWHREERLADAIITAAAKGGSGAVGLDDTLEAIRAGRVQTLVISEGYRKPGYHCLGCGYLTTQPQATCPFCSSAFEQIPDTVEMAVQTVMKAGGDVQVLHSSPKLESIGMIGAVLRY
jgi:peptide chain release factor subunit 1